jgi:hypothetical protein
VADTWRFDHEGGKDRTVLSTWTYSAVSIQVGVNKGDIHSQYSPRDTTSGHLNDKVQWGTPTGDLTKAAALRGVSHKPQGRG